MADIATEHWLRDQEDLSHIVERDRLRTALLDAFVLLPPERVGLLKESTLIAVERAQEAAANG